MALLISSRGLCSVRWIALAPKLVGDLESLLDRVDREHRPGAGGERHLDGAQADGTEPEHRDAVAGLDARLDDRVIPRAHHVAGEQRGLVGDAVGNLAQRHVGDRHQRLFGLGALERPEQRPVAEDPHPVALVVGPAQAEEAGPAGAVEAAEHSIACLDPGDPGAGLEHGADELMTDGESGLDLHAAVVDVEVRPADAARLDRDDRIGAALELGRRAILDSNLVRCLKRDCSHRFLIRGSDPVALLVGEESLSGLAPEPTGQHQAPQLRRGPVALLPSLDDEPVEHLEHVIEPNSVGPRERTAWMVEAENHAGIDVGRRPDALHRSRMPTR